MTEQNISLIKLSILLSRFSNMAEYNLSCWRESKEREKTKATKPKSHNRNRALCPQVMTPRLTWPATPNIPGRGYLLPRALAGSLYGSASLRLCTL